MKLVVSNILFLYSGRRKKDFVAFWINILKGGPFCFLCKDPGWPGMLVDAPRSEETRNIIGNYEVSINQHHPSPPPISSLRKSLYRVCLPLISLLFKNLHPSMQKINSGKVSQFLTQEWPPGHLSKWWILTRFIQLMNWFFCVLTE